MPVWFVRPLLAGTSGPDVKAMQAALGITQSGVLDDFTQAYVRGVQRVHGLEMDGEVDKATALCIGGRARVKVGLPPTWFEEGRLERAWELLGSSDPDTLKRYQGNRGLPATGILDERTAIHLGE